MAEVEEPLGAGDYCEEIVPESSFRWPRWQPFEALIDKLQDPRRHWAQTLHGCRVLRLR